jgi:S-adenosylhomocysteine hydrolase
MLQITGQMSSGSRVVTTVALCIFATGAMACIAGNELQVMEHHIIVQEYSGDMTQSSAVVSGTAGNTGNWNIRDCKVSVSFYDYKGNVLAVISDGRPVLGPGETWGFKIELTGKSAWSVARYSITSSNK